MRGHKAPHRPGWGETILVPGLDEPQARELFLRRAGERHASSGLLPDLLADMDGVPLAIELLGAQVRADELDLERVAKAWREKRTELLASRPGGNHQLDSYEVSLALSLASPRMTEAACRLYAMLGRLPAGLRQEWAELLLPGESEAAATVLGDLGLAFDGGGRLRMLAPVREHAAGEQLAEPWATRLADHWLRLAREQGPKVGGAQGREAVLLLGSEWSNLESAFDLVLAVGPQDAIDAAIALTRLIRMAGLGSNRMLRDAKASSRAHGDDLRLALANESLGDIALARSDHEAARQHYDQALPLYQKVGNVRGEANCIKGLGDIAAERSEDDGARQHYEQSLPLYQRLGDLRGEANCILALGDTALRSWRYEGARQHYEDALPLYQSIGAVLGVVNCIRRLGDIAMARSDHEIARQLYGQALPLYEGVGDVRGEANCIKGLGDIALASSEHEGARQRYEQALLLYRQVGSVLGEANCIQSLGEIALGNDENVAAGERFREALALYRRIEQPYSIGWSLVELARLAGASERGPLVAEARAAWVSIDRPDLVTILEREFGTE